MGMDWSNELSSVMYIATSQIGSSQGPILALKLSAKSVYIRALFGTYTCNGGAGLLCT